jgi:hypothetical protein
MSVVPIRIKKRFWELNSTKKKYSLRAKSNKQTIKTMIYFFFIVIVLPSCVFTMNVFTTNQI